MLFYVAAKFMNILHTQVKNFPGVSSTGNKLKLHFLSKNQFRL
jgi:hypothetical protein